ncbi:hypothetical protein B296_00005944 [Ensete ventricosum]|uniref:Uncharacterized protein n=1 Tax=Ensete ventricosum TaxID=4639 RepID=A0A426XG12_ENSVE|nr:hypothetical protein B296_00005944 [Ensete ventricosum]
MATIFFARIQEEQLNHEVRRTRVTPRLAMPRPTVPSTAIQAPAPKKLIRDELHERSTKELCWHCNEPWSREHHRNKGHLLVIEPVEDEDNETSEKALELKEETMEEESPPANYAVHALVGYSNPQMMKVGGLLKQQPITVLIERVAPITSLILRLLHVWHFKSKLILQVSHLKWKFKDDDSAQVLPTDTQADEEHHCKKGQLLVIEPTEDEDNETSEEALEPKEEIMEEESQSTNYAVHALAGYSNSLMIAPTKEPKLEDMTLEPKEKDTLQPATRTVPTLVGYTNLQKLKIEGFLEQ